MGSPASLSVTTILGNISIRGTDTGSVHIVGTVRAFNATGSYGVSAAERVRQWVDDPPIRQNGNSVAIETGGRERNRNVGVSYEIEVPRETRVIANDVNGSITIQGVHPGGDPAGRMETFPRGRIGWSRKP